MKRFIWTATLLTVFSLGAVLLAGAQEGKSLSDTVAKTVETQQQTQKKQEAWAEEKNDLAARYRTAKAQVDYLEKTKAFEEKEVSSLDAGIAELNRRMVESANLKDNLEDSLNVVVNQLDSWVKQDIPFLMEERQARLASVRDAHRQARGDSRREAAPGARSAAGRGQLRQYRRRVAGTHQGRQR
jgi:chromosome segregation ATPase